MADLLRSGNTMLNMACPVCNNPLFRNKEGNTFCPTCNRNVVIIDNSVYQKDKIKDPKKAKRTKESILAEAILSKNLGWEIEFISGGYESLNLACFVKYIIRE